MKKASVTKGKFAVVKKNDKVIFAKKAKNAMRIECDESLFEVSEKSENELTKDESGKIKKIKK